EDDPSQVLEIHLVNNSRIRRNDSHIAERFLSPAQEGIPLFVALKLKLGVQRKSLRLPEFVYLNGVVDYKFRRLQRIDERRIPAQFGHGIAHGGKIHDSGHPREVLHENTARRKGNLFVGLAFAVPRGKRTNIFGSDVAGIFGPEKIFKKNTQRIW